MEFQSEVWCILKDDEYEKVWNKVYSDFKFSPSTKKNICPFTFKTSVDIYDISTSLIWHDNAETNEKIRLAFVECINDDDYMYALDWQHTSFRYNPRIIDRFEYPVFVKYEIPIKSESALWDGYNVWFPTFYPNGDYYFFIAKNFTWGYFTHPWLKKAYVFGSCLRRGFKKFANEIGFICCDK